MLKKAPCPRKEPNYTKEEGKYMKLVKRFVIWAVIMAVTVFCVNLVGTVVVSTFLGRTLSASMTGYSKKGDTMLHPTLREPDEKNKTNGLAGLAVRALLDDTRIMNGMSFFSTFVFMNDTIDQSVIFLEADGSAPFSRGSYEAVYEKKDDKSLYIRSVVGLICVDDFCKNDCAEDVYDLLKNTPNAVIKVNSYSISDFLISPAELTVYDEGGNALGTFSCPCEGSVINADNIYVHNGNESDEDNDMCSFFKEMEVVHLGERRSDREAEKLAEKVSFNGDAEYSKTSYGLGHMVQKSYEVSGDYAMVTALDYCFIKSVILYAIIFAVPITLLTFLVGRKKKES